MADAPKWGMLETKQAMIFLDRLYQRVDHWNPSELDENTLRCLTRAMDFVDLYRDKVKDERKQ